MGLFDGLKRRAAEGRPVRVGIVGAGKFGSMYPVSYTHLTLPTKA